MARYLFVLILVHLIESKCIHTAWMQVLSCHGSDIIQFPALNRSVQSTIRHMDILNTSLTHLPDLRDWVNLASIDIRENAYLECSEITQVQNMFSKLNVWSDCDDYMALSFSPEDESEYINFLYALIALPFLSVSIGVYFKAKKTSLGELYKGVKSETKFSSPEVFEV